MAYQQYTNPYMGVYQPQAVPDIYPQYMQQPINGLVSVTGIEGARAYRLPPNSKMPLFDADSDVLYVKTTDAGGFPTIRAFSFSPIEQQDQPRAAQGDYTPRSEFDKLADRVDDIADRVDRLVRTVAGGSDAE